MSTCLARSADGVSIAYQARGQGPALLFVHGLGDCGPIWSNVVASLTNGFRCVTLDLRGHGQSDADADFQAFGLARDVSAVMDALTLEHVVLIGHSLGGFVVSVSAGSDARVRAVVNVDQPLALAQLAGSVRALGPALYTAPVAELLMGILAMLGLGPLTETQIAQLRAWRERLPRDVVLGAWAPLLAGDDAALEQRMHELLARVRCPYLSLHGSVPPAGYESWLAQQLPQAQRVHWENVGHFPHLCRATALAELLRGWIETLPAR